MNFDMDDETKKRTAQILGGILGMAAGGAIGYGIGEALSPQTPDPQAMDNPLEGPRFVDGRTGQEMDPHTIGMNTDNRFRVHFADGTTELISEAPEGLTNEHAAIMPRAFNNSEDEILFEGKQSNHNGLFDMPVVSEQREGILYDNIDAYTHSSGMETKEVLFYEYLDNTGFDGNGNITYLGEAYGNIFKDK